ncbi:hypothetical protein H0H92_007500 [Tricholoma furcatifolium]|nr:hypothetical protein H0H92_007500 [Tricholoma furcatifolium]
MSFLAAARQSLSSTTRASLRNTSSTFRAGARRMNSSHAAHTPKSDTPWIVGSAILFGPALLYLLSPSARKQTHFVHNDAHDFPSTKKHAPAPAAPQAAPEPAPEPTPEPEPQPASEPEPVLMKDSEGTEANIADALLHEADDVPKADPVGHDHVHDTTFEPAPEAAAPVATEPEVKEQAPETSKDASSSSAAPADVDETKEVKEGVEPKKAAEESA